MISNDSSCDAEDTDIENSSRNQICNTYKAHNQITVFDVIIFRFNGIIKQNIILGHNFQRAIFELPSVK